MEYHWYEDYWDIPRRSPKGHVTGSGYYIDLQSILFPDGHLKHPVIC